MPVRFHCAACHQYLGVTRRKIGCFVTCPKCQSMVLVPDAQREREGVPDGAEFASGTSPKRPTAGEPEQQLLGPNPDIVVYDDIAAVLGAESTAGPKAAPETSHHHYVSIARQTLYVQAGLIVMVATLAFVAGFYSGRGGQAPEIQPEPKKPVTIAGRVAYQTVGNPLLPDDRAVVVVFPRGAQLAEKIPVDRLRPDDPPLAEDDNTLQAIESSTGIYRRTDTQGQFEFRVRPGVYEVLVISKHAQRPPGTQPKSNDLFTLESLFKSASDLIGPYRYDYSERRLPDDAPLNYTFGVQ